MIGNGRERTKCSCWKTLLTWAVKYIRLRESVFNLWRERKESHEKLTDSEFAEFLLHRSHGRYDLCQLFLGMFFRLTQRTSER